MYKIEITTHDERETLLYADTAKNWDEASHKIDCLNNLKLNNVFIKLYKTREPDQDDLEYLGNFTDLKACKRSMKKRSIKKSNIIIILEILFFPVFLLLEIVKNK